MLLSNISVTGSKYSLDINMNCKEHEFLFQDFKGVWGFPRQPLWIHAWRWCCVWIPPATPLDPCVAVMLCEDSPVNPSGFTLGRDAVRDRYQCSWTGELCDTHYQEPPWPSGNVNSPGKPTVSFPLVRISVMVFLSFIERKYPSLLGDGRWFYLIVRLGFVIKKTIIGIKLQSGFPPPVTS